MLDTFYSYIIKEASIGRIDCFGMYNIVFNTSIPQYGIYIKATNENPSLTIPTLIINNKDEFDKLLIVYVNKCLDFYDDNNYYDEIIKKEINDKSISKEKVIMSLLWSNATLEDFNDPISFLRKRISFLENDLYKDFSETKDLGYSETFKGNLNVIIEKSKIENETPYSIVFSFIDLVTKDKYVLPRIYFGIDDKAYIYAIQNDKNINDNKYSKTVNRTLYQLNKDVIDDTEESIKDVSLNFVLASTLLFTLLYEYGIKQVVIPSFLITRWNSKEIMYDIKQKSGIYNDEDILKNQINHERIQNNLTNKLMRTFKRNEFHNDGINIISYPYELDSSMHVELDNMYTNNTILNEMINLMKNEYNKQK